MLRSPHSATALVQALCGVVLAGFFVVQSAQVGTPVPLLGALIALVGFGVPAYRNLRRHEQQRAGQEPVVSGGSRRPRLSPEGDDALVHVIGVLASAGVFAPRTPDPDHLTEAVVDAGEPVTAGTVLSALHEAGHHHPEFRPDDHDAVLAFHDHHVEQLDDTLIAHVADLDRLAGDALEVRAGGPVHDGAIDLVLGGREVPLRYRGHPKNLSTVLHVTVARALRDATDARRLAWLWVDQGVWLAALPARTTVGGLNSALDAPAAERWEWVDEQEPVASGEV